MPTPAVALARPLDQLLEIADAFAQLDRSPRTLRAYASQWRGFVAWCASVGVEPLPASPETVCAWMAARAADHGVKVATIAVGLTAIDSAHRACGLTSRKGHPTVARTWAGIRRQLGAAQRRAVAITPKQLAQMSAALPDTSLGIRDRALLVVGFAGAFRRSELAALDLEDCEFTDEGLRITVRSSKTDQEGVGVVVGLPYGSNPATCPVRTLRAWIARATLASGALFRAYAPHGGPMGKRLGGNDVARVVKRSAMRAGLDPAHMSGHSLRAGLATAASRAGKSDRAIMLQGRWKSRAMLDRYVRDGRLLDADNAAAGIGL